MALDPRLDLTAPNDPLAGIAQREADLGRRVAALERTANVQTGSGAPTSAARDGTLYVDITATRLYVRANGVWRYAALITDDLKNVLALAAIEAANAAKNATNLSVVKAQENDYASSGSVSAMAVNVSTVARDLTHALAELETAYPTAP